VSDGTAGVERGTLNLQDLKMADHSTCTSTWKMQDLEMTDEISGLENGRPNNFVVVVFIYFLII